MTNEEKITCFTKELILIRDEKIRKFTIEAIKSIPDYFFTIPASTTGKYHPSYALGEGGLLRHTRAMAMVACELFRMERWGFSEHDKDLILSSILLHDGWKLGDALTSFTVDIHPAFAVNAISENENLSKILSNEDKEFIKSCVHSHMGQWNKDKSGKVILPKPATPAQEFVHLVDYICSRKCLEINFDAIVNR